MQPILILTKLTDFKLSFFVRPAEGVWSKDVQRFGADPRCRRALTSTGHWRPCRACLGRSVSPLPDSDLMPSVPQTSTPPPMPSGSADSGEKWSCRDDILTNSQGPIRPRLLSRTSCPHSRLVGSMLPPRTRCLFSLLRHKVRASYANLSERNTPSASPSLSCNPAICTFKAELHVHAFHVCQLPPDQPLPCRQPTIPWPPFPKSQQSSHAESDSDQ